MALPARSPACLPALPQELQMAGINFKAFDLGGHEIARRVWKDYYAKVCGCVGVGGGGRVVGGGPPQ